MDNVLILIGASTDEKFSQLTDIPVPISGSFIPMSGWLFDEKTIASQLEFKGDTIEEDKTCRREFSRYLIELGSLMN